MPIDREQYQSFVEGHPSSSPFHFASWLDAVCKRWDFSYVKRHHKLVAVWPYKIQSLAGFKYSRALPLTPHLGPLISTEYDSEIHSIVQEMLVGIERKLLFFNQVMPPKFDCLHLTSRQRFPFIKENKQVIELDKKEGQLFGSISHRKQRYIRSFEDAAITESSDPEALYRFNLAAHKRRKTKQPFALATLKQLVAFSLPTATTYLHYLVTKTNIPLAGTLMLQDRQRCYLLCSGWNPKYKHNGALSALVWHGIKKASKEVAHFDFHGSMNPGIAQFNRSMGGIDQSYYRIRSSTAALDALKKILPQ